MRAITKLSLISLLVVGLLAAPLALAGGPQTGEERSAAGKARGEEHRASATTASDTHRNASSDRANVTAARTAWRENATLLRESWHENATATRERCHAADSSENATHEERTAHAQCIKSGYATWREANMARIHALREAFLALLRIRAHHDA